MISCIIIEDQPPAQRVLQKYIQDYGNLELKGIFNDALSALEFLRNNDIDLVFLDIHLPKISGIDFLNILSNKPQIILTTAYSDYAIKSYELDVLDYLLKPFSFERFVKAVSKAKKTNEVSHYQENNSANESSNDIIFIKSGYDFLKILVADIQYIKSEGDYSFVFTSQSRHLVAHPLKYWNEKLSVKSFCQVHKSYIVNVAHIDKVSGNEIYLKGTTIPIGRTFKNRFFEDYL